MNILTAMALAFFLAVGVALLACAAFAELRTHFGKRRGVLAALLALAAAAVIRGGDKPEPPKPKKEELVIIVEPLSDCTYSTRMLHVSKEELNEIKNDLGN